MSLRLLAGPFPITDDKGVAATAVVPVMWYPDVGLIVDTNGTYRSVVTLDGVYQTVSPDRHERMGYWIPRNRMIWGGGSVGLPAKEYMFEPKALARQATGIENIVGVYPNTYTRLENRRVYFSGGRIHAVVNGVVTLEGPAFAFGEGLVLPGRHPHEVFVAEQNQSNSRSCFYNTLSKTVVSQVMWLGMNAQGVYYSPEFGVIVSVHATTPGVVRVWSLEVKPATMSAITIIDGLAKGGYVTTYQVQVTGDHADPCIGELIDWEVAGVGNLLQPQTVTDDAGYATTQVQYALDDSGGSTVTAKLSC